MPRTGLRLVHQIKPRGFSCQTINGRNQWTTFLAPFSYWPSGERFSTAYINGSVQTEWDESGVWIVDGGSLRKKISTGSFSSFCAVYAIYHSSFQKRRCARFVTENGPRVIRILNSLPRGSKEANRSILLLPHLFPHLLRLRLGIRRIVRTAVPAREEVTPRYARSAVLLSRRSRERRNRNRGCNMNFLGGILA